jgi:SAM-dependent methyltransferase
MDPLAGSQWSAPSTVAGFAKSAPNAVLMKFAEEELRHAGSRRALDLGCGAGRNAVPLVRLGWTVVGTDLLWPTAPVADEPFVFTQFSGEPQCFLTESQLFAELGRVGFAPDPSVPFRECNRPQSGALPTRTMPVIYEAAFRHGS